MTVLALFLVVFAVTGMVWLLRHPEALRDIGKPKIFLTREPGCLTITVSFEKATK